MSNFTSFVDSLPIPPHLRMHLIPAVLRLSGAWSAAQVGVFGEGLPHARVAIRATVDAIGKIQEEAGEELEGAGLGGIAAMAEAFAAEQAGREVPKEVRRTMRAVATFAMAVVLELGVSPEEIRDASRVGDGTST